MKELFGKIKASLVERGPERIEELTELINTNILPPEKISSDEVHIRAMYIVSDRVNSAGGRFPAEDHQELARLLVDSPVLVGHRKDSLPIARNFHAETVQRGNERWIKVYFYWLKKANGAENLKNNIDGGIYKEGSISFVFGFPECGICGGDIRNCEHRPFVNYRKDGEDVEAYFNYRKIFKVLETSLVYRGAVHDTSLTGELFTPLELSDNETPHDRISEKKVIRITSLDILDRKHRYLVRSAYESLPVILKKEDDGITLSCLNGMVLGGHRIDEFLKKLPIAANDGRFEGRLIGFRGKERRPVSELIDHIEGRASSVRRMELRLCGIGSRDEDPVPDLAAVRSCSAEGIELAEIVARMRTRLGAEIEDPESGYRYLYCTEQRLSMTVIDSRRNGSGFDYDLFACDPLREKTVTGTFHSPREYNPGDCLEFHYDRIICKDSGAIVSGLRLHDYYGRYRTADMIDLGGTEDSDHAVLEIVQSGSEHYCTIASTGGTLSYRLRHFDVSLYEKSRRFLAESVSDRDPASAVKVVSKNIMKIEKHGRGLKILLGDDSTINICPAIIGGRPRYLFYRIRGEE